MSATKGEDVTVEVGDDKGMAPAPVEKIVPHAGQKDHQSYEDGSFRAAVFGFSDGLVSTVSLLMGVAGGDMGQKAIVMTGLSGMLAGAASMACGEYISVKTQAKAKNSQLKMERKHLKEHAEEESREFQAMLREMGLSKETAADVVNDINKHEDAEEKMLMMHAKFELGIDPEELGSPVKAAMFSYACFSFGAIMPLWPWIAIKSWAAAFWISVAVSVVACFMAGYLLSKDQEVRKKLMAAGRQLGVAILAAGSTYLIGMAIGEEYA